MSRKLAVLLAPAFALMLTAASSMGPPWISIEHPVNPYDASTRDAFLVVHAFHHGTPVGLPVSGTAEGLVSGQRRSVPLQFAGTSRTGVYALRKQWPENGTWTLLIAVAQGPNDRVTAVVDLAPGNAEVSRVQVPTRREGAHRIPAAVSMSEIESSLKKRGG